MDAPPSFLYPLGVPQTGIFRPDRPFFVKWADVEAKDFIRVKVNGREAFSKLLVSPGAIGVSYGMGPKEWCPKQGEIGLLVPWIPLKAGDYAGLLVNEEEVFLNCLCIHSALMGFIEARRPEAAVAPPAEPSVPKGRKSRAERRT